MPSAIRPGPMTRNAWLKITKTMLTARRFLIGFTKLMRSLRERNLIA